MTITAEELRVFQRPRHQLTNHYCQLGHLMPGHTLLVTVSVRAYIGCLPHPPSHFGVCHVLPVLVPSVPAGVGRMVVLILTLLLLMSGDIEMNPGPLTLDDLPTLYELLESIQANWHNFGLQLRVRKGKLDGIAYQYSNPLDCLREILTHWLKTSSNCTWKCIVEALGSRTVGANALALELARKFCPQMNTHEPQPQYQSQHTSQPPHIPPCQSVRLTAAMVKYAHYLKVCYTRSYLPENSKFPPSPSKHYINLTYATRRTKSKHESDKLQVAMVHGEIAHDEGVDFSHVAEKLRDGSYPQVVLVEGAPGVGKTTFAWEFCRKWGKGELKQEYSLVILLRLRDKRIQEAKCLKDLFYHPDETLPDAIAKELINSFGEGVLILLEGLDELPEHQRTESSVFLDLIHSRLLPQATVLITTRPWASEYLHRNCKEKISQHIEIRGFTKQQINDYLQSVCEPDDDPTLLSDIEKYLSCYPQVHAAMYIPLNAAIVVQIYRQSRTGECIIPKTMTQLYTALSQTLLIRYLKEDPVHRKKKWKIHDFSDLPSDVYGHFLQLSKVAYDNIKNDQKLIVSSEDLPDNLETLGFMQSVPELYVNESFSHNFLHLTIQEYLAAFYITQLSPEEQLKHLKECGGGLFKVVMRFVAGLSKFSGIPLESVRTLFENDDNDPLNIKCDYTVNSDHVNWLYETQDPDTINDILGRGNIIKFDGKSHLVPFDYYCLGYCTAHSHCQWKVVLQHVTKEAVHMLTVGAESSTLHFSKRKTSIVSIQLRGYTSEGLALLEKTLPHHICVDLHELTGSSYYDYEDNDFSSLIRTLSLLPSLKVFKWKSYPALHNKDLKELCDLIASNYHSFEIIKIEEAEDPDAGSYCPCCDTYSDYYDNDDCQCESYVTIEGTYKDTLVSVDVHIDRVADVTRTASVLRENSNLGLHFTAIRLRSSYSIKCDHLACQFAEALHDTTTLKTLRISHNPIRTKGAVAIMKLIRNNKSLEEVDVRSVNINISFGYDRLEWTYDTSMISVGDLRELCDLLVSPSNSLEIIRTEHYDSESSCVTIEGTHQHTSLSVHIKVSSVDDVTSAVSVLKENSNLGLHITAVRMWNRNWNHCEIIDSDLACQLAEALCDTETKELELVDHPIGTKGAMAIVKLIHNKKSLEKVEVRGNNADIRNPNWRYRSPSPKVIKWRFATCTISVGLLRELCGLLRLISNGLDIIQTYDDADYDESYVRIEGTYQHTSVLVDILISSVDDVTSTVSVLTENSNLGLQITAVRMWNLSEVTDGDLECRLAKALCGATNLKTLKFINHPIAAKGAAAIAQLIRNNKSLEEVKLSYCNIDSAGAAHLALTLCENTALRRLDFSGNSIGAEGAVALAKLICSNKPLEEIRISKNEFDGEGACYLSQALCENTTVRKLDLAFNPIETKGAMALAKTICNSKSLEEVDVRNCNIDSEGACHLAQALCENTTVSRLDFSYNPIGTKGATALSNTIQNTKSLKEVYINCCDIGGDGACRLALALCENTTVSKLDLSYNPIGTKGATALANTMNDTKSMEEVYMSSCDIDSEGVCHLVQALCENTTLRMLDLSGNSIGTESAMAIAPLIRNRRSLKGVRISKNKFEGACHLCLALCESTQKSWSPTVKVFVLALNSTGTEVAMVLAELMHNNKSLQVVDMKNCNIDSEGARHLSKILHENTEVRTLDLSYNPIRTKGAIALAELIHRNKFLQVVDMKNCKIDSEGACHLAKILHENTTVRTLDLSYNPIRTKGAIALAELIHRNKFLQAVDMENCNIDSKGARHFAKALHENTSVRKLNLSRNPIATKGAMAIAKLLRSNKSLEEVHICRCNIDSEGVYHLALALCKNNTMEHLSLALNPIEQEGADALAVMLRTNKSLHSLDLYHWDALLSEEDIYKLLEALTVNSTLQQLILPGECEEYAKSFPRSSEVASRVVFTTI